MSFKATILGCGSSGGVPRIGFGWGDCDPENPKNRRRRCSLLVERHGPSGTTSVLIDAGPDMREQMLAARVNRLDAVIISHDHADHTHGLDDIRPLVIAMRKRMDIFMSAETSVGVLNRFRYIFQSLPGSSYPPIANERRIHDGADFEVNGPGGAIAFRSSEVVHGEINCTGFRIGSIAYSSDLNHIPQSAMPLFDGLDVWIIDALRHAPHPSHFSLEEALEHIARFKPKRAVLTNLHTDLDYAALKKSLPAHVEPAYDGMVLEWD